MAPSSLNWEGVQTISGFNLKRKRLINRLELNLESGMWVVFVVEGQRCQRKRDRGGRGRGTEVEEEDGQKVDISGPQKV